MDAFYATKLFKLQRLLSQLDAALLTCRELERHEAGAPAGEACDMPEAFESLADLHSVVQCEIAAVRVLAAAESH